MTIRLPNNLYINLSENPRFVMALRAQTKKRKDRKKSVNSIKIPTISEIPTITQIPTVSEIPTISHSASMAVKNVSLKLLVDTKGHRVLFAEASKDFVDFLFNILSLLVGTVIRLLTKKGMVGCLGNLYDSIENLSDTYMQPNQKKDSILKPTAPNSGVNVPLLLPNVESSTSKQLYKCVNYLNSSNCRVYVADDPRAACPHCRTLMTRLASYVAPPAGNNASSSQEGGFVKGVITYMVMDDLVVEPMSTISSITILNKFKIKEVGALEEKVINLGMDEGVKLLKASLQSKTVLTDVFLGKKEAN